MKNNVMQIIVLDDEVLVIYDGSCCRFNRKKKEQLEIEQVNINSLFNNSSIQVTSQIPVECKSNKKIPDSVGIGGCANYSSNPFNILESTTSFFHKILRL